MSLEHKLAIEDDLEDQLDRVQRGQWLRAAILGSNDGLLSTTSLMLGMAAVSGDRWDIMLSGLAAAVAGACSMAVGEYVSVATQRDIEGTDHIKNRESQALVLEGSKLQLIPSPAMKMNTCSLPASPIAAVSEACENTVSLTPRRRSLTVSPAKAPITATSPARKSLIAANKRSPLMRVISEEGREEEGHKALPNPLKAGAASAIAFLCGAIIPLLSAVFIADQKIRILMLVIITTIALAVFGGIGAYLGGSSVSASATRVLVGGWISMGVSYGLLKPLNRLVNED